jgi:hypothetical protein
MATTRLNLPLVSPVCGKLRFFDRREAQQALESLRAKELAEGGLHSHKLNVYRCPVCGDCWHVGHRAP